MQEIIEKIRDFFNRYESRVNRALDETPDFDAKETSEAFSDFFIAANPNGVACGKNDEKFQLQILHGYEFYRSIGTKSMKISHLTTTSLDGSHWANEVR